MLCDLTIKKSQGKELTKQEYYKAIELVMSKGDDVTVADFFRALNIFGMTKNEVCHLALAIKDSGKVVNYENTVLEKHSTGGIGDSTSLVLIPLLACLGYTVVKTTSKSLTYTNGSADRFGSIPNFSVMLTDDEIKNTLSKTNACILSHNGHFCPADRILYDVMETYNLEGDLNLLAASIAAKKLASGANIVLIDVKFGHASVIKTYANAIKMAKLLKYIFKSCGVECIVVTTNTAQMIGSAIGNAVEVIDALNVLQGKKCALRDVSVAYAVEMICKFGYNVNKKDAYDLVNMAIDSGNAYNTFLEIVELHGGDVECLKNATLFKPYKSKNFISESEGYVGAINYLLLGDLVKELCLFSHDPNIGVVVHVKVGDYVKVGEPIISFYYKYDDDFEKYKKSILNCVKLTKQKIKPVKIIQKVIR